MQPGRPQKSILGPLLFGVSNGPSEAELATQRRQISHLKALAVSWAYEVEHGLMTPEKEAKYKALTKMARAEFDGYAQQLWAKYCHPR